MRARVVGLRQAQMAVDKAIKDVKEDVGELISIILAEVSIATTPRIPIDTSELINSEYRTIDFTANGVRGVLGYGAEYAYDVHESPGYALGKNILRDKDNPGRGYFWDPNGQPGFLAHGVDFVIEQRLDRIIAEFRR